MMSQFRFILVIGIAICLSNVETCHGFRGTGRIVPSGGYHVGKITLQRQENSMIFNVLDYGAKGDGRTDDTQAFQKAWKAACEVEASTILVPSSNVFLLGPSKFVGSECKSNIIFQLDGTIMAPPDLESWGHNVNQWIEFTHLKGSTFQGKGTIDGRGSVWWGQSALEEDDETMEDSDSIDELEEDDTAMQVKSDLSQAGRIIAPCVLKFSRCSNLTVSGIRIQNSPKVHLKFNACSGLQVHHISLSSPGNTHNTDGINVKNSEDVVIHSSSIACGDDCIAMESGCSNINIYDVNCGPGHGISIGSLGKGNKKACVSDISVRDININNAENGVRIKTWQGGSGSVKNVKFSNIKVSAVRFPIIIDQYYCDKSHCHNQTSAVAVDGITYEDIQGTFTNRPMLFACSDSVPCANLTLSGIQLTRVEKHHDQDNHDHNQDHHDDHHHDHHHHHHHHHHGHYHHRHHHHHGHYHHRRHLGYYLDSLQDKNQRHAVFCWQSFGKFTNPNVPPMETCIQVGQPPNLYVRKEDSC